MTHDLILLFLNAAAVFRLTILFSKDKITGLLRRPHKVGGYWIDATELFDCPWCVSIWAAILVVVLTATWDNWPYAAAALALSGVAGFLSEYV